MAGQLARMKVLSCFVPPYYHHISPKNGHRLFFKPTILSEMDDSETKPRQKRGRVEGAELSRWKKTEVVMPIISVDKIF